MIFVLVILIEFLILLVLMLILASRGGSQPGV